MFRAISMTDLLRRRRLAGDEGGFTLIEVIVALVIFTMILATTVSMLIASTKASLIAKMDTGAKNLAQERVEQVRNLPFHKDHPMSGAVPSAAEADDLLDTYFLSYSATDAACKVTGFVHGGTATASTAPPAGSVRCTYFGDPATGDFYRVASNPVAGYPRYAQYITTQFLPPGGAAGTPLTVPSTYNTQGDPASADVAVSDLVGIRVTTLWSVGSTSKKNSIFSTSHRGGLRRPPSRSAHGALPCRSRVAWTPALCSTVRSGLSLRMGPLPATRPRRQRRRARS